MRAVWGRLLIFGLTVCAAHGEILPGFQRALRFDEQALDGTIEGDVRFRIVAPASFEAALPTRIVFYATPNGSSIEETLGRRPRSAGEWRFDIQHVAAQIRRLRELRSKENLVLACLEPEGKSWPAWCGRHDDAGAIIRRIVEAIRMRLPGKSSRVALAGHSGGGAFLLSYLAADRKLPEYVERVAFLDANYAYSDSQGHGDRLLAWLDGDSDRRLVVIAYDDRAVTLDGKPVVPTDGGTYRATQRMIERFAKDRPLVASALREFDCSIDSSRQIGIFVNRNYANRILHSALVGDMNGLLQALTFGTAEERGWGVFGGQRAFTRWIEPPDEAVTPEEMAPRPANAESGASFMKRISCLSASEREAEILNAITGGNIPDFLRGFRRITIRRKDAREMDHTLSLDVMPDYLSVGSDGDYCRIPMAPATAQAIATRLGCILPTPRLVDEIYRFADTRLEPRPLVEEREAITTFVQHNAIIEEQRRSIPLGPLVAGIKKDIVITNKLSERPSRVAIYGWHRLDGRIIQPVSTVHGSTYVDYSHGVRLVSRQVLLDGQRIDIAKVLQDPNLAPLLSDEGVMRIVGY